MNSKELKQALKDKALALGFSVVGVVPARPSSRLDAYLQWIGQGFHGEMGYLARADRLARRNDLSVILPGVNSIICVGLDHATQPLPAHIANDPSRGRISNYAWGRDYHTVMTPRLEALGEWLESRCGGPVASRAYVDTGAVLERSHAEEAGLGFVGKNTMLIAPRRGSWLFLGELLTTVELDPDPFRQMPACGNCRRCLAACPTAAFPQPYVLDARLCISYLTIEMKGWIPRELRPLMGNWIFGCDICQEVCPFNRFAPQTTEASFWPVDWEWAAPPLPDLLALDDEGFDNRFGDSPIRRIRRGRLVRNACVAAGNWADPAAIPALGRLLADPEPLIRGHAAWALGRIGGREANHHLSAAEKSEGRSDVIDEIRFAISHSVSRR
jgi:epoxyqueuosine reductase